MKGLEAYLLFKVFPVFIILRCLKSGSPFLLAPASLVPEAGLFKNQFTYFSIGAEIEEAPNHQK